MDVSGKTSQGLASFLEAIKVDQVMAKNFVKVYEDDNVSEAQQKFVQYGVYYLIVVDHDEKLVGLLSRKYVYKAQSPRKIISEEMDYEPDLIIDGDSFYEKEVLDNYILRNIMLKHPFTLAAEETLSKAILNMVYRNIVCIPIVDKKNNVLGVLTYMEILEFLAKKLS